MRWDYQVETLKLIFVVRVVWNKELEPLNSLKDFVGYSVGQNSYI